MIKSMTGFGLEHYLNGSNKYNIEIKSVNGRFLRQRFKGLQFDLSVENKIKEIIK